MVISWEDTMTVGIYSIKNIKNNKRYIGLSTDIEERWKSHLQRYNVEGREYNKALYRSMRKHGIQNFQMEVLEECLKENLSEKEMYYIKKYDTYNNGYNETFGGEGVLTNIGEMHPNSSLSEKDVLDIRKRYNNKERRKDVYQDYKNKIGSCGFKKVWTGETWTHIGMEVYTEENSSYQSKNSAMVGSENGRAKLTEEDVYNIRLRRKNGETINDIYPSYKHLLTRGSFSNVYYYQNWKHVIV